ncbi:MAG: PIN domain-containing protein [Gemmatimonadota bacterium]|jgi:predicted nucleic acid-binding protein
MLLDTDVLIDVALDRKPHAEDAAHLLTLLERRPRMAFVAWHTLSNFYYLVSPTRGRDDARHFLADLTRFVTVAPTDTDAFHFASTLPFSDFEDAMQVAAARACGATCIATRNVKDFRASPIPARKPEELVRELE